MKQVTLLIVVVQILNLVCFAAESGFSPYPVKMERQPQKISVAAPHRALAYLTSSQAQDGHWPDGTASIQSTAFCLSAFLRMGETIKAQNYGNTVKRASDWLHAAVPTSAQDSAATIVALSDFYNLHRTPATAQKVNNLLETLDIEQAGAWGDLLSYTRLPDGISRPSTLPPPKSSDTKYRSLPVNVGAQSVDDYLKLYLISHAKYRTGSKQSVPLTVATWQNNGSAIPSNHDSGNLAAALAALSFAQCMHGSSQFDPQQEHDQEEEDNGAGIEIDIRVGPDGNLITHEVKPGE